MEIHKILDRFEILNPQDEYFKNLRRAYIDSDLSSILEFTPNDDLRSAILTKNIYSIFRCIDNTRAVGDIEDLRKAVLEQNIHSLFRLLPGNEDLRKAVLEDNMHSIFRLVGNEDLKKAVMDDNIWSLFRLLKYKSSTYFVDAFKNFETNDIQIDEDCFSRGQLRSKLWLVDELKKCNVELGKVFLCAGWYATLATMLFESDIKIDFIRSFDVDPDVWKIAEVFNKPWVADNWKFKASTEDIHEIRFVEHIYDVNKTDGTTQRLWTTPDTVINTSCEHINNFDSWYDSIAYGSLVIMQSNNYFEINEHVNCHETLESFAKQVPLGEELYSGELELEKYKRFMRIGYK